MYINVEKSLKKGRLVYYYNFWGLFFTLLIPIIIMGSLLFFAYILMEKAILQENTEKMINVSLYTGALVTILIAYFLQSRLKKIKGKSRSNNVKLVREFAEQKGYEIIEETNEACLISVEPKFFKKQHERDLFIIYDKDFIYYNCTTFESVHSYKMSIENFRNPLLWFNNKRHERRFRKFIESNL